MTYKSSMPAAIASIWRTDIDALAFAPDGHDGLCMVHRRAFRVLIKAEPAASDCESYFRTHVPAFQAAARAKIVSAKVAAGGNFHLTSRDVARHMPK